MRSEFSGARAFFGFILIAIGVWFLLDQTGLLDIGGPWRWIPSFFILFILWHLAQTGFRNLIGPLVLMAVALLVQVAIVGDEYNLDFDALWPAIIILAGIAVVFRGRSWGLRRSMASGDLDILAIFGGSEERLGTTSFNGGRVTVAFGGAEIDLRDARVGESPAVIDMTVAFGGCEITVPSDWAVDRRVFALFGGTSDKRRRTPATEGGPELVITGVVLFGGLEIKD